MIPYLIWVGYGKIIFIVLYYRTTFSNLASALNISIWQLNSPYAQPPPRRLRPASDPNEL
jgi:hypothetical protein